MYETIFIEKNKSTRTGVYFYENSQKWNVFWDICGLNTCKTAVICHYDILKEEWKAFADGYKAEDALYITQQTSLTVFKDFIDRKKREYIFVVLWDKVIMDGLYRILSVEEPEFSYICVPATSYAVFDGITVRPLVNSEGKTVRKEILPLATYVDISLLTNASTLELQDAFAAAFRLAVSYKASMFEWMIANMYELTDREEASLFEFMKRAVCVWKERIEKDTAKDRAVPVYGEKFYEILRNAEAACTYADVVSLSMVCQTCLSWKKDLITMEEFYEIRDMFVLFGLSITETKISAEELWEMVKDAGWNTKENEDFVYIRKLGKLVLDSAPSDNLIQEAMKQIYFDEESNE